MSKKKTIIRHTESENSKLERSIHVEEKSPNDKPKEREEL